LRGIGREDQQIEDDQSGEKKKTNKKEGDDDKFGEWRMITNKKQRYYTHTEGGR
jgi:hypothetical protein